MVYKLQKCLTKLRPFFENFRLSRRPIFSTLTLGYSQYLNCKILHGGTLLQP